MADHDNLRDRIEDALRDGVGLSWQNKAQAIIDEFGLTVEERLTEFGIDDPGYQQRVIGKWEER